jgi:hypothetical protein
MAVAQVLRIVADSQQAWSETKRKLEHNHLYFLYQAGEMLDR